MAPAAVNVRPRSLLLIAILLAARAVPAVVAGPLAPWQRVNQPTAADAARVFSSPPPEYSAQFTWGWQGPVDRTVIERDLDGMKALGVFAAAIEPKTGMTAPYLSPGYFELVKIAVAEARKRDMRIWIMDDGDYPSGHAGGKFTLERPELRMKVFGAPERIDVAAGATFRQPVGENFVCAIAATADGRTEVLEPTAGELEWTPREKTAGEVSIVRWVYRTLPTRSANNPANVKDTTHSLMDYLSPEATEQFEQWTFERYRQAIGGEFGRTVLGFRGDEPAYGGNPFTPRLLTEFHHRKGYDLRPYLAAFAGTPAARLPDLTADQRRAYADYCDVWSDLYRDSYFDREASWCGEQGLEFQLHIEHEEMLPQLAIADGDYFKVFRHVQVPGIDIIWHQLWMDNPADFPKLASSAAHLYGHPRAMCEAFAAYRPPPDLKQAKWLLNFLFSRGITRIEYMFWPASVPRGGFRSGATAERPASPPNENPPANPPAAKRPEGSGPVRYYRDPGFPAVAAYVNRLTYLLGEGRPGAEIGLYLPSSSFWIADAERGRKINAALLAIGHDLIARQRDFDYVDEQALTSVLRPDGGTLVNQSGQHYRAIIVPPIAAISARALERLKAFAHAGGRVIFLGVSSAVVAGQNFRDAQPLMDLSWATLNEPEPNVTERVLGALPESDVTLATPAPLVSYTHRQLRDADVYFLFNAGDDSVETRARLAGDGSVEIWDPYTGQVRPGSGPITRDPGRVTVALAIPAWSTTVVVLHHAATALAP